MADHSHNLWAFYRRWIWANGWSELIGLGGTAVLAWLINRGQGTTPSTIAVLASALLFILTGTLCEGVLVGYAQGKVLHERLPRLSLRRWIQLTAVGAGLAWTLGMIPSTIASLHASHQDSGGPPFEGPMVFVAAAAMGIVLGPFLGVPQWLELRKHLAQAGWWIVANSAAWAVGMVIVFLGATAPSTTTPLTIIIPDIAATCLIAGLVVGAIHGWFLLWLSNRAKEGRVKCS